MTRPDSSTDTGRQEFALAHGNFGSIMATTQREELRGQPLPGYAPEIGIWLWALQQVRRRTLRLIEGLGQRTLDWKARTSGRTPPARCSTISRTWKWAGSSVTFCFSLIY